MALNKKGRQRSSLLKGNVMAEYWDSVLYGFASGNAQHLTWSIQDSRNAAIMFSGGALGSYHDHICHLGNMTDPPLSPLGTSSSQVPTMPFLISSRCAEASSQPISGTSPFNLIPGEKFTNPAVESKHDCSGAVATTTAISSKFPSSTRRETPSSGPPSPEASFRLPSMSEESQRILYHGTSLGSYQSAGADTSNTPSSGTSAGSCHEQVTNEERRKSGEAKGNICYSRLHQGTSTFAKKTTVENGSEPSKEAEDWDEIRHAQTPEQSTMHTPNVIHVGCDEILLEGGSQDPGETSLADHNELENSAQPSGHSSSLLDTNTEQEKRKLNQVHVDSSTGSVGVYRGETLTQSNVSEIFPVYNTSLMSSDSYNFPTGAELLAGPTQNSSHPSHGSAPSVVDDESTYGTVGGLFPNPNLVERTVYSSPTSLKVNWESIASQYVNTSLLDNSVHNSLPGMAPLAGTATVSTLLSENLQDDSYSHGTQNRDGTINSYFSSSYGEPGSETSSGILLMSNTGSAQVNIQSQQRFLNGTALPPVAPAQRALAQHSHLASFNSDNVRLPPLNSLPGSLIVGNPVYNNWRSGGNELLFLPGSDSAGHTQSYSRQQGSQLEPHEIIPYGLRTPSVRGQVSTHALYQSNDSQSPTSVGNCQSLSLSLSSQQPSTLELHPNHGRSEAGGDAFASQAAVEAKGKRSIEFSEGRYNGILSRFRPQRDDLTISGQDLHTYGHLAERKHQRFVDYGEYPYLVPSSNSIYSCKYLKLSQFLLNEICIVRKFERRATNQDHQTAQRWTTSEPASVSVSNSLTSFHTREVKGGGPNLKDYMINSSSLPATSTVTEFRGRETVFDMQLENREELDQRRRRLTAYLHEVDKRYRSYGEHMMDIINHFNSIAGPRAATPYTALALQAMSRHFRCLRDAVSSQLRSVKRTLGEQDTASGYAARGEIPTLRFVDQQLRQQRALQQLGMLQQHAWRPQRGLPERAVSVLRSWLFEHFLHPYPKDSDKLLLAKQTGLTRSQVSNWFINARVRLWKPMVEEMYLEEFNNSDEGGSGEKNLEGEQRRENDVKDYNDGNLVSSFSHTRKGFVGKQRMAIACGGDGIFPHSNLDRSHGMHHGCSNSVRKNFDVATERGSNHKKARNCVHNSVSLPCPMAGLDIDSGGAHFQDLCRVDGHYGRSSDQNYSQNGDTLVSNLGRFGCYIGESLAAYPANFISKAPVSTNGGVSLTLGLRHSDGLSLPATGPLRKYSTHRQPLCNNQGSKDHRDFGVTGRNLNSEIPITHLNPGHESLKQRHSLPEHFLIPEYTAQG